jgi:Uma2 family endonuclease
MTTAARRIPRSERVIPPLPVRRFSVEEYHRLIEAGILKSGDPYELLDGWIVPKMTIHPPHNSAVRRLARRLNRLLSDDWVIQVQGPITFPDNEPEPDVVIALGPETKYDNVNPGPKDVALVAEVADTSVAEDQGTRLRIYARARIPVYWIVNLIDRRVEVYSQPHGGRKPAYRRRRDYGPDEKLPVVLGGRHIGEIAVREILP